MEIRSVKDACFSKLASFYIVIRFSCFYLYTDLFLCLIYTYICIQYCIDTWPGLYTESFVTFSEDMSFFSWFTATDRFAFCRKPVWLSWRRNVVWVLRVCGNWVVSTHMLLKTNTTTVNLPLTCLVSFSVSTSKVKVFLPLFDSTEMHLLSHFSQITNGQVTKNMFFLVAVYWGLCYPIIYGLYTEYAIFRIPMNQSVEHNVVRIWTVVQLNSYNHPFKCRWWIRLVKIHQILDLSHFCEQGDESYFQHQATKKVNI